MICMDLSHLNWAHLQNVQWFRDLKSPGFPWGFPWGSLHVGQGRDHQTERVAQIFVAWQPAGKVAAGRRVHGKKSTRSIRKSYAK